MKRFNEMTKEELGKCTEDQIHTLIDLEVAYAGILPVLPPTYFEVPVVDIQPTEKVYKCSGIIFANKEDADLFAEMKKYDTAYNYGRTGSDYAWLVNKSEYEVGVQPAMFYTKEAVEDAASMLERVKRVSERNSQLSVEYSKYRESIQDISSSVREAQEDAKQFLDDVEAARKVYAMHLELAEGDVEIAKKFFKNAYKARTEIIEEIFPDNEPLE